MASNRLFGSTPSGLYIARADDGKIVSPNEAIFPIVSQHPDGTFIAIGTGFFIGVAGIFVTAAHVITDVLDEQGNASAPFGLFQFLAEGFVIRPIFQVTRHIAADVAVGIAAPMSNSRGEPLSNKILTLSKAKAGVGDLVCTYAFPKTHVTPGVPQLIHFTPAFFEGFIRHHYPEGRDRTFLPGPCYESSLVLHGAASGGPVVDHTGRVIAVNSTGYEGNDVSDISFVSCISSILQLALDNMATSSDPTPRRVSISELIEAGAVVYR